MAITLVVAMIICFAFRSLLVRIMQAPLRDVGSQVGALKALGITDSIVISFHLAFYAGMVISFPLLLYFLAEFVLPALTAVEKRFLLPAIFVSFALFLLGVFVCYFWLLPKTILFFFRDTESLGWAPPGQCSSIILLRRDSRSFWSCFRITGRGFSPRAFRIDHLQVHGAHPALRHSAYLYPGDDHHADAGHLDVGCNGTSHVSPLRKLHLDCVVHGTPQF